MLQERSNSEDDTSEEFVCVADFSANGGNQVGLGHQFLACMFVVKSLTFYLNLSFSELHLCRPIGLALDQTPIVQTRLWFQLSFSAGDKLMVHERISSDWWWAELRGSFGYVPSSYLQPENGHAVENEEEDAWQDEEYFGSYGTLVRRTSQPR